MRQEFPAKVKMEALARSKGRCERQECGAKLTIGKYRFDHIQPCELGGKPTLDNCQCICLVCDKVKTFKGDLPQIAKMKRQQQKHLVGRPRKPPSKWKRTVDGRTILRNPA